jgi:hypothetical protein
MDLPASSVHFTRMARGVGLPEALSLSLAAASLRGLASASAESPATA